MLSPPEPTTAAVGVELGTRSAELALRDVLRELAKAPTELHELSARRFELLVGESFKQLGFEVSLSHRSRDAGIDIVTVFTRDAMRAPMALQCKRYPPNRQMCLERISSFVASSVLHDDAHASMVTTADCLDYLVRDKWFDTWQKPWRTRCTVDLDRGQWIKLFLWMAGSADLNQQLETRVAAARRRHAVLIDKKFAASLDTTEQHELAQLELLLDAADAPFYEPIKSRLRAILDGLSADSENPDESK
jgi:hypothetical protein